MIIWFAQNMLAASIYFASLSYWVLTEEGLAPNDNRDWLEG